jgi:hypothetical protein
VAPSFSIGFLWQVEQFALPILSWDVTVFRRNSFDHSLPAQHVDHTSMTRVGCRPPAPFG